MEFQLVAADRAEHKFAFRIDDHPEPPLRLELTFVPAPDEQNSSSDDQRAILNGELEKVVRRYRKPRWPFHPFVGIMGSILPSIGHALSGIAAAGVMGAISDWADILKTLSPPAIGAIAAVAGAWVQARYGRKVRLKVNDVEVEARTEAEIGKLLEQAAKFQQATLKKGDEP